MEYDITPNEIELNIGKLRNLENSEKLKIPISCLYFVDFEVSGSISILIKSQCQP